jgi:sortase (surface protein transpeptidase)
VLLVSLISISIFILPKVYFSIISPQTVAQTTIEEGSPIGGSFEEGVKNRTATESATLPPIDENLPKGTWIIIPRIGVRTEIQENNDSTKALEKGVWRVPGYGQPGQSGLPIILASHRYGYTWWWQNNYWKYNSFHLLPETQPGDMIEIISGQRKYTYEVYAGAEGQEITDYNADLILYTCKFLDSPVRFFRYARLVDWNKNTQASAALQN